MDNKSFELYLKHLETYQCLIIWALIVGLILSVLGAILIFILKDYSKKEKLIFKLTDGFHLNLSSTLSGSIVTLSGAIIVVVTLITIQKIFPKINGDGWTTTSLIKNNDRSIVGTTATSSKNLNQQMYELNTDDKAVIMKGFIIKNPKELDESKMANVISIPLEAIKDPEKLTKIESNDGKILFLPIQIKSNGLLDESARQKFEVEATSSQGNIEIYKANQSK